MHGPPQHWFDWCYKSNELIHELNKEFFRCFPFPCYPIISYVWVKDMLLILCKIEEHPVIKLSSKFDYSLVY